MDGKTTIADVAERAQVARSTVSHVLSGKRPISGEVKERVFKAISDLGYRPSLAARSLKGERTKMIGALVDNLTNPISGLVIQALSDELRNLGYGISVCVCGESRENGLAALRSLSTGFFDGILNMLPEISALEAICACQPVPTITYARQYSEAPVFIDFGAACRSAMDYLWDYGHRRIGVIVDLRNKPSDAACEPRFEAYKAYLEGKGCFDPALCCDSSGRIDDGIAKAPRLHALGCTAILCGNDQVAAGALLWAREAKVEIPGELSLIGHDDTPVAMLSCPQLSTIQYPAVEIAKPNAQAIVDKIEGRSSSNRQQAIVVPKLIVRGSSGPARK